jgi:hypothetical protein
VTCDTNAGTLGHARSKFEAIEVANLIPAGTIPTRP